MYLINNIIFNTFLKIVLFNYSKKEFLKTPLFPILRKELNKKN